MDATTPLNTALIIFVRHPKLGQVKTRLASVIGDEKALKVYQLLLEHTKNITAELNCRKFVYYSEQVEEYDLWNSPGYTKRQQTGNDLGERMLNAFKELFEQGFKNIIIIGSDCYQLKNTMIKEAFELLDSCEVVIGPTFDGGYYLLGMNHLIPNLFYDKAWSTDHVFEKTLQDLELLNLQFAKLQQLHDVDVVADLELNGIEI
ncbi:MAG: TIGR04282 family arsenosugar biosynthesis glycosyltransferase [Mucilaginibacter sp.]|uniref:TIGR04282 family arsenosugar biosynthesis glycosyltransferase n=1 Tax=Mucilaginibacter sp. TaxID=1882438 RepID=UPI0034E430F6